MSYRTILVYLNDKAQAPAVLSVATGLAEASNGHLIGLYVVPNLNIYVSAELSIPDVVVATHLQQHREHADQIKEIFEQVTGGQNYVAEWREVSAVPLSVSDTICDIARTSDVTVIGQRSAAPDSGRQIDIVENLVMKAGRPVIAVPDFTIGDTAGRQVFVAWDGSSEATRAVFDALPVLREADAVTVHQVNPEYNQRHRLLNNPAELVNTLSRHGVNVTLSQSNAARGDIGDELLQKLKDKGAGLMVMGAYSHARIREQLFGGTTRQVLQEMPVPVLMSH